ncbi:pentatricopeptide repeat-containing protein At5g27110-like [Rhodamnia argentea]|uniref:Pentatricopeptide repeat-containing protein At5g27110-like n=1 Tax=Rhodamnia argentea TaxID=178133 RepID=A0A8B8PVN9_9MYRT|nr:pentatricopeptide repeat-containing protein At5g27110-like [Rhodamnia argentea]
MLSNSPWLPASVACFARALKLCKDPERLKPLKCLLIVNGLAEDGLLVGELIKSCFRLRDPRLALSSFRGARRATLSLQNSMVRGLCDHGLHEQVLWVYGKCRSSGCPSDNFTLPLVLKACAALGALDVGKEIHCVAFRAGFEANVVVQTALLDFYSKTGRLEVADKLIDLIPEPDLVSWNALIAGSSLNGLHNKALELFGRICAMGLKPNVSTLACVIPACTCLGRSDIGRSLHGLAFKSGHLSNGYLAPALVSMYAIDDSLCSARDMFESLPEKNVAVWNALIHAYKQKQKAVDVFEIFHRMVQSGIQPNAVTFVCIIPACENLRDSVHGKCLHALTIKHGIGRQISVGTSLVSSYAKHGDINSAKSLFDDMPDRNLLTWNSLISGYVHNRLLDESLAVFSEMQFVGLTPDPVSIISIVSACSKLNAILLGKSAHAFSEKMDFVSNLNVSNALLAFYCECHELASSFALFNRMASRDVESWNTLISGCVRTGHIEKAWELCHFMQKEEMKLDFVSLISILPSYVSKDYLLQGMILHCYAMKMGFALDVPLVNALISMYCNCGDLHSGSLLFKIMPRRDLVSWNALMTGYRNKRLDGDVLLLFHQMMEEDQMTPNDVTLINLLPSCCSLLQGQSIHAFALRRGILRDTPLLTSLVSMYTRFDDIRCSLRLFETGDKLDISLWNSLMSMHVQTKYSYKAVDAFCQLLCMGLEADHVTVLILISASAQLTIANLALTVLSYVIRKGFKKDIAINNSLIDLYARCGNISIARDLFNSSDDKDLVSWNVMINAYGVHGKFEASLDLLSRMELTGMKPDAVTYSSILSVCSHAGLVHQAKMIFRSMVEQGVSPNTEHYSCMVDLLGRRGHLHEAFEIVKGSPHLASTALLESLLGACSVQGNAEIADGVCKMLLEGDPTNSVPYVKLHNTYAVAGRWMDASRVRSDMERRGLRKVPGYSLVHGS